MYVMANLAQFERRQVSERVAANFQARAERGLYNGGVVPVGYRLIPEKPGYLAIDETQAEAVRACFQAYLEKGTLSAAAKWLNLHGHKLRRDKQGGGHRPRLGHFTVENLYRILTNKASIGIRTFPVKGQDERGEAPGNWDALINPTTFDKIGTLLRENRSRKKPESASRYPFLLSRKVSCGTCHARMVGKSAHGNSGKVPYYEHGWATKRDGCLVKPAFDCAPFRVQAKILEPAVWEEVLKLFRDPGLSKALLLDAKRVSEARLGDSGQKRTESRISSVIQQIEVLAERLAELPKSVSAAPIYMQTEKLQTVKSEEEERLRCLPLSKRSMTSRLSSRPMKPCSEGSTCSKTNPRERRSSKP